MKFDRDELSNELLKNYIVEHKSVGFKATVINNLRILLPLFTVLTAIIILSLWYAGRFSFAFQNGDRIDIIMADPSPVRVKPDDPGGMYIANKDKMIYDNIERNSSDTYELPEVNELLSQIEQPIERNKLKELFIDNMNNDALVKNLDMNNQDSNEQKTDISEVKREVEILAEDANYIKENTKEAMPADENNIVSAKIEQAAFDNIPEVKEKAVEEAAEKVTEKNYLLTPDDIKKTSIPNRNNRLIILSDMEGKDKYSLQLAAFKDKADVQKHWEYISKKYDILKNLQYYAQRADLGDKGVYYRLKVGPFEEAKEAAEICDKLRELKQGCIFVKN